LIPTDGKVETTKDAKDQRGLWAQRNYENEGRQKIWGRKWSFFW
jgi:hypothetical protein